MKSSNDNPGPHKKLKITKTIGIIFRIFIIDLEKYSPFIFLKTRKGR